jgi:4-hydroxy-tetrahydrodipicolinate synthase
MTGNNVLLVTPFDKDYNIDYPSLGNVIEYVIGKGVNGLIVLGTTGEFFTMTNEEKQEVIKFVIQQTNNRVPVCVGVGYSGTKVSIDLAKYAEFQKADSLLVMPPYYYPANDTALTTHFLGIAKSVDLNIMYYDGAGGIEIPAAMIKSTNKECPNIRYVKASVLKNNKVRQIKEALQDKVEIFCGDEVKLMTDLKEGASGMATAIGNVLPEISTKICDLYQKGEILESHRLYNSYVAPWMVATGIIKSDFIRCHKEALFMMNIIKNPITRQPLGELSVAKFEQLEILMDQLNLIKNV